MKLLLRAFVACLFALTPVLAGRAQNHNIDLTTAIPDFIVLGNPDGDIEIHEFSDYFCPYCQRMTPEMAKLVQSDGNIRLVLHYFPNHGQRSLDFSSLGIAAYQLDPDNFYELHQWIMAQRSRVTLDGALDKAESLGYARDALVEASANPDIEQQFRVNFSVADALGIRGTPSLTIENAVSRGFPGIEPIASYINDVRNGTLPDG